MLITSFSINQGPPPGSTNAELIAFYSQYSGPVLWGAWLQAVGPLFIVLFAFAIVSLSGAATRVSGLMTVFGGTILMMVSLVEVVFYITALYPDPATMASIGGNLIYAVQHLYFIVAAPALFVPLGTVILSSHVLPRVFGYLAYVLGAIFGILGVTFLTTLILPALVTALGGIQVLWWLAAAITLIVRTEKAPATLAAREQEVVVSTK